MSEARNETSVLTPPCANAVQVRLISKEQLLTSFLQWKQAVQQHQSLPGMDATVCAAILAFDPDILRNGGETTTALVHTTLARALSTFVHNEKFMESISLMEGSSRRSMLNVGICHVSAVWKVKSLYRIQVKVFDNGVLNGCFSTAAYAEFGEKAIEKFAGDLASLPNNISSNLVRGLSGQTHVAKLRKIIEALHPQAAKKSARIKLAREYRYMVPGFTKRKRANFVKCGYSVLPKKLPAKLTAELLEWHQKKMKKAKGRVHARSGVRTITWKDKPAKEAGLEFNDSSIKTQLETTAKIIANLVGRCPDSLMRHIHLLQIDPGQTQQNWHQDAPFPILGAMVHLESSLATEFLEYDGKDLSELAAECRAAHLNSIWALSDSPEPAVRNKGRMMQPGSIVVFNTSHLHRAPPPPKQGERSRKVIFFSFEADVADAASVTVFSHNRSLAFPQPRAHVRRRRQPEVARACHCAADAAAAASGSASNFAREAEEATVSMYASLLANLSDRQ